MNRNQRAKLAEETVQIVQRGWYIVDGAGCVSIEKQVQDCVSSTRLFRPQDLEPLLNQVPQTSGRTTFEVQNETTLSAADRLAGQRTLCLNFASAKNPGGGFLGGSQAQEESLACSSALYASLLTQPDYYQANRHCETALYTDHMILSPDVPVIRDDEGNLLQRFYLTTILTAPAVNAGAVRTNESSRTGEIHTVMKRRLKCLLAVAASTGFEYLVLGAWGCGVFRNDPREIATLFAAELQGDGNFAGVFKHVVFAVLDKSPDESIITPFRMQFERRG